MSKLQKVYRLLRENGFSPEGCRYAAPRLIELGADWMDEQRRK